MQVTINGEQHTLDDEMPLASLLQQLDLTGKRIAVEINQEIVPRSVHQDRLVKPNDTIEIIHAIGGG